MLAAMSALDLGGLADLGQVVAGIASVGTLIAVVWQLGGLAKQTREAALQSKASADANRATVYLATAQMMIGVDQFLADRPELRMKIYGPTALGPSDIDGQREAAVAEMIVDMIDAVLGNSGELSEDESNAWIDYIEKLMQRSPAVRQFWMDNRRWYSGTTLTTIDKCFQAATENMGEVKNERDQQASFVR